MRNMEMIDWTNLEMELSHLRFEKSGNPGRIIVRNDFFSAEVPAEDRRTAIRLSLEEWKDFNLITRERYIDGELTRKRLVGLFE